MALRHGLSLPLFGPLADLRALLDVGVAADESGIDGMFVWDHVLSPVPGEWPIADPWVALAALASATSRLALGPMVTPIARRRLATLARATQTLDRFSDGRLILGLGLGSDRGREFAAFGERDDPKARAAKLSEGAVLLKRLWAGERVVHRSEAWVVDDVRLVASEEDRRDIPIWMGCVGSSLAPARRAARFDGLYPVDVDLAGFRRLVDLVATERGSLDGFDIAVASHPQLDVEPFVEAGATWVFHAFWPGHHPDQVLRAIDRHTTAG